MPLIISNNKFRRKKRSKINNVNKNILGIVDEVIRERPTNGSRVEANSFFEALNEQEADMIKLNEYIEDLLLGNAGKLSTEMENSFVFTLKVKKCRQKLKSFLNRNVDSDAAPSPSTESMKTRVELPKLVLEKFSRDPLEWNQFRKTYEASIHLNTRISKVQIFSHLINYLDSNVNKQLTVSP